jgi:hypothetical protein
MHSVGFTERLHGTLTSAINNHYTGIRNEENGALIQTLICDANL